MRPRGARVVVLLDEFQEVRRLGGEVLAQRLRAAWQSQRRTAYLLLGSFPTLMAEMFADRHAALYRFADVMPMPTPEPTVWTAYLGEKLGAAGATVSSRALDRLAEWTGGHPDDTVRAANEAYAVAVGLGRRIIDTEVVDLARERTIAALAPAFEAQIQRRVAPPGRAKSFETWPGAKPCTGLGETHRRRAAG